MKKRMTIWMASAIALTLSATSALADITIGITIPVTGPGAAVAARL